MKAVLMMLAVLPMLTACMSSPKNTYYTLNAPAISAANAMTAKTRVLVGPVTLPSSVDGPLLVVNSGDNQVRVYEYQRWAGSLKNDVAKVIAANLARDLSTPNVWTYEQSTATVFDYQVFIDVQNLDSRMADAVVLDVLWTVKPVNEQSKRDATTKTKTMARTAAHSRSDVEISGRSVVREQVATDGFGALVAAQSRALAQVSEQIAKAIHSN